MYRDIILPAVEIRALSWKNPYGPLMLSPYNKKETRIWNTKYRGLVLICCSQQNYTLQQIEKISGSKQMRRIYGHMDRERLQEIYGLKGNAFAIGNLVDCHKMRPDEENDCYVEYKAPWTEERKNKITGKVKVVQKCLWVHVYRNVVPIEPFLFKGRQGWAKLSEEIKLKIKLIK
jgi:hypothetical protein